MIHTVKATLRWFPGYADGSKTWSLRQMDRAYRAGDVLHVVEFDGEKLTGREVMRDILRVDEGFQYAVAEDFGILSLGPVQEVVLVQPLSKVADPTCSNGDCPHTAGSDGLCLLHGTPPHKPRRKVEGA